MRESRLRASLLPFVLVGKEVFGVLGGMPNL
jgi:hypothetical protein